MRERKRKRKKEKERKKERGGGRERDFLKDRCKKVKSTRYGEMYRHIDGEKGTQRQIEGEMYKMKKCVERERRRNK